MAEETARHRARNAAYRSRILAVYSYASSAGANRLRPITIAAASKQKLIAGQLTRLDIACDSCCRRDDKLRGQSSIVGQKRRRLFYQLYFRVRLVASR